MSDEKIHITVDSVVTETATDAPASPEMRDGELTCPCGDVLVEGASSWVAGQRELYCCTCRSRFELGTLRELHAPQSAPAVDGDTGVPAAAPPPVRLDQEKLIRLRVAAGAAGGERWAAHEVTSSEAWATSERARGVVRGPPKESLHAAEHGQGTRVGVRRRAEGTRSESAEQESSEEERAMTDARPPCCQTAQEADTVRWSGFRWTVALYIERGAREGRAVEAPAGFCPFCGEKLLPGPDKHHPMRRFAHEKPEELLELYAEAMKRAAEAERRADALAAQLRRLRGDGRLTAEEAATLLPELGPAGPKTPSTPAYDPAQTEPGAIWEYGRSRHVLEKLSDANGYARMAYFRDFGRPVELSELRPERGWRYIGRAIGPAWKAGR